MLHPLIADPHATRHVLKKFKPAGGTDSSKLRDKVGAALGLGYGNVKTFVRRLNSYGVTREEFLEALKNVTPADC